MLLVVPGLQLLEVCPAWNVVKSIYRYCSKSCILYMLWPALCAFKLQLRSWGGIIVGMFWLCLHPVPFLGQAVSSLKVFSQGCSYSAWPEYNAHLKLETRKKESHSICGCSDPLTNLIRPPLSGRRLKICSYPLFQAWEPQCALWNKR